tara:strand:- start:4428 stop:4724 length:297 start_codon:yes stop_codon:yes gene_type:complete
MDKIEKGEIIYGNLKISYQKNNRNYIKNLNEIVFSKKYNDELFPILDNKLYSVILRKLEKNIYHHHLLKNIKVLDLKIIARTGYIDKKYYENITRGKH